MIPLSIIDVSGLLNEFSTAENHSQHADTNTGTSVDLDMRLSHNKSKESINNIQARLVQICKQTWHDRQ